LEGGDAGGGWNHRIGRRPVSLSASPLFSEWPRIGCGYSGWTTIAEIDSWNQNAVSRKIAQHKEVGRRLKVCPPPRYVRSALPRVG
jgi:hypothetical protein